MPDSAVTSFPRKRESNFCSTKIDMDARVRGHDAADGPGLVVPDKDQRHTAATAPVT